MAHHRHKGFCCKDTAPDMDETKDHIMAAGREILLAAQGALSFCREYVETQVPEPSRPNLLSFFQKAMSVADELSRGLTSVTSIKRAAGEIAKPLFTAMDREMKREAREMKEKGSSKAHRAHKARKPAAKRQKRRVRSGR